MIDKVDTVVKKKEGRERERGKNPDTKQPENLGNNDKMEKKPKSNRNR